MKRETASYVITQNVTFDGLANIWFAISSIYLPLSTEFNAIVQFLGRHGQPIVAYLSIPRNKRVASQQ